jgi:hypothetical protein
VVEVNVTTGARTGRPAVWLAIAAMVIALFAGDLQAEVVGRSDEPAKESGETTPTRLHPRLKTRMKNEWGVEVLFVRPMSAGYMLEFRYRVLDADKASPLFERQTKPVLTHVETGATMIVPTPAKTGALRNSNMPIEGRTYWMFFANPAKFVKSGDHVTIEIGDFVARNLIVE